MQVLCCQWLILTVDINSGLHGCISGIPASCDHRSSDGWTAAMVCAHHCFVWDHHLCYSVHTYLAADGSAASFVRYSFVWSLSRFILPDLDVVHAK